MNRHDFHPRFVPDPAFYPLWLLTFLGVMLAYVTLLKRFVGPTPFWVPSIGMFGAGGSLGVALGQRMGADRRTFLYFLRV